jgi:hypothetical protein
MKYIEKLIKDSKFEEFRQIAFADYFIKSYQLFKKDKIYDCPKSYYGIILKPSHNNFLINYPILSNRTKNIYEDETCFEDSYDKIEISMRSMGIFYVILGQCKSVLLDSNGYFVEQNSINVKKFESISEEKITKSDKRCVKPKKEYSYENCYLNCYFQYSNNTFGFVRNSIRQLYFDLKLRLISGEI